MLHLQKVDLELDKGGWSRPAEKVRMVGRQRHMPDQDGWQRLENGRSGELAETEKCQNRMVGRQRHLPDQDGWQRMENGRSG